VKSYLDRAYVGRGVVVTVEQEDAHYYVLITGPMFDGPMTHSVSEREKPARRKFAEVVEAFGGEVL
jgi:hypothetical protein